jgi:hypothetical protein
VTPRRAWRASQDTGLDLVIDFLQNRHVAGQSGVDRQQT